MTQHTSLSFAPHKPCPHSHAPHTHIFYTPHTLPSSQVCVDEAHCVAEWGHSFRPAYFRLGHVLRCVLRPKSVLALTATATRPTARCIAQVCVGSKEPRGG